MKNKARLCLLAIMLAFSTLVLSGTALAHYCYHHYSHYYRYYHHGYYCPCGGVVFSQEDGKWYHVPSRHCMVYRVVDDRYIPVARRGYCRRMHHHWVCHHRMVGVTCEVRPAHWWVMHWMPASKVCYYYYR